MTRTTSTTTRPTVRRRLAAGTLGLALAASGAVAASAAPPTTGAALAQVRAATAHYHSVEAAVADGYVSDGHCVPQMGYHFQRGLAMSQGELDPTRPEILVYAPRGDGSLRLVAVEYAAHAGVDSPTLLGQAFHPPAPAGTPGPPFQTLHAWVWQGNPDGTFAAFNPNVDCG